MPAPDDIRRWSNELASDPHSVVFADLADALRQQGDLETAERLALRGLERHPSHAAGIEVLAKIAESRGDLSAAAQFRDRIPSPEVSTATGAPVARARPTGAMYATGSYVAVGSFSATLSTPPSRPEVVRSLVADADGLLLASPQPSDDMAVLESMAAAVAGVGDDAARAMKHLNLGNWHALVLETGGDTLALAPAPGGSLTVLSVAPHVPIGRVRALLRVATARAAADGF
jgi:predicted regulator of Ras-like GTPase activity (Roadblock/LC7/MglB family)